MLSAITSALVLMSASASVGAADNVIWQIGRRDNTYTDLAIAQEHARYNATFPRDVTYTIGKGNPVKDWSFIHPGPADTWAGSRAHAFTIRFKLDEPVDGTACLLLDLVDAHASSAPRIEVDINGTKTELRTARGAGDQVLRDPKAGRQQILRLPMAGSLLGKGDNTITLRNVEGSWLVYDAVQLKRVDATKLQASLRAEPQAAVIKTDQGPRQVMKVTADICGPAGEITLSVAGQTVTQHVPETKLGGRSVTVAFPPVKQSTKADIVLKMGDREIRKSVDVEPIRPWTVYLVQHTHSDVGYPDTQAALAARLVDFIDAALDYVDATRDYPDDAKFRWTCEATWSVELFLDSRTPQQVERLRKAIADGRIELAALPMNMTDLATEEVLVRSLHNIKRLRRELGAKVLSAMQNDVNGYALSLPRLLSSAGVKYFATGINRTRSIVPFDRPTGLHWEAPDGSSVLTWRGEHYMAGNYLGTTSNPDAVVGRLTGYLKDLKRRGYPHKAVLLQLSGYRTDDAWPSTGMCDLVRAWNERYAWPKLRVATISEFFKDLEAADAAKLPRIRKAWCDWWADGNGTAVQEVSLIRQTHEELESAVALLAASASPAELPGLHDKIEKAFRRTLMFDEHTWGYAGSISQPDSWMSKAQWRFKSAQAYEAAMLTATVHDAARVAFAEDLPTDAPSLVVQNPSSWPRGGIHTFRIPAPATYGRKAFRLVDVATGKPVAVEKLGGAPIYDSMYLVDVPTVPALGYRVLRIDPDAPEADKSTDLYVGGNILSNDYYHVEVDPKTGALFSLRDKVANRELVAKDDKNPYGLLRYVYEEVAHPRGRWMFWPPQKDLKFDRQTAQEVKVSKVRDGYLMKELRVSGKIADGHTFNIDLQLCRRTPRLDISINLRKPGQTEPEAGYLAFPLALHNATFDIDAVGGTFQPGPGQIDGTASDYHSIQRYVRLSEKAADGIDVIVTSKATPLVQIGDIHVGQYQQTLEPPGPQFYMWLFNNYWFTNFPASQGGEFQFGFALTSRKRGGKLGPVTAAHRRAVDTCTPLAIEYLPAGREGSRPADRHGLITIEPSNVMMTGLTWTQDRRGVVARIREFEGKATTAKITLHDSVSIDSAQRVNVLEEPQGNIAVSGGTMTVSLKPHEMVNIRLNPYGK